MFNLLVRLYYSRLGNPRHEVGAGALAAFVIQGPRRLRLLSIDIALRGSLDAQAHRMSLYPFLRS